MNDKKLKPWTIGVGIIVALAILGLFIINPLKKVLWSRDMVAILLIYGVALLLAWVIPWVRKNENLWRIISGTLSLIFLSGLYFFFL